MLKRHLWLWALACLLLGAALLLAITRAHRLPAPIAVMYLRHTRDTDRDRTSLYKWEATLTWRPIGAATAHTVTTLLGSSSGDLGFLPSPEGAWALQWGGGATDKEGWRRIAWQCTRIRDGKVTALTPTQFFSAEFLPHWIDDHRVALERTGVSAVFDTRTGKLSGELREPKEEEAYTLAPARLAPRVAYAHTHYARELQAVSAAYPRVAHVMGFDSYARLNPEEPREFLFLRTLGLPGREVLYYTGYRTIDERRGVFQFPSASPSPDGRLVACAYVSNVRRIGHSVFYEADAKLAVFEVQSGKQVWATALRSRPWNSHGQMFWTAPPPPSSEPEFTDLRWDTTGRYLVFTARGEEGGAESSVRVMDTRVWKQVLRLADASDAFLVSAPE